VLNILKSGSLNLLELLGPAQACNGIALPLIAKKYSWLRVSLFSSTNCLWNDREKGLLSKNAVTEGILSAEWGYLYVRKSFVYLCNEMYTHLLITNITLRGTKSSITIQSSFKEICNISSQVDNGIEIVQWFLSSFQLLREKGMKTDYDITHISLYLYLNHGYLANYEPLCTCMLQIWDYLSHLLNKFLAQYQSRPKPTKGCSADWRREEEVWKVVTVFPILHKSVQEEMLCLNNSQQGTNYKYILAQTHIDRYA
jgi:hypothetical protein